MSANLAIFLRAADRIEERRMAAPDVSRPRARPGGLWRDAGFRNLWGAHAVSLLGSQVTALALPLTAALALDATPAQMGLLGAAGAAPALLLGLLAGVWVDRRRRRPIMIAADLGRAALLLLIPAAALLGALRIELLYAVALLSGTLTLLFEVAYRAFVPALLSRERLVDANSKLELGRSAAEVGGPGLAGGLIGLAGAPLAIAADAVSFLISALLLARLRAPEPDPAPREHASIRPEIGEGLRTVAGSSPLRALAGAAGVTVLFSSLMEAVFVLYLTGELGLTPVLVGLIFASGNVGFLAGALLGERVARRVGVGPAITGGLLLSGLGDLLVPLAGGPLAAVVALLLAAQFLFGCGLTIYNINQISLRQALTPDHLQGRVSATFSLLLWSGAPIGALVGGAFGEMIGLRGALLLAAAGELGAALWLWRSPLRALREPPAEPLVQ
jgi:MFS family permease